MKRRIAQIITWALIISALFLGMIHLLDRALAQQEYKTCMQLPEEIKGGENCGRFQ